MNEITVAVPAKYIAALMLFVEYDPKRPYLNGIYFEIGQYEARLVATDGARLGVVRIVHDMPLEIDGLVSCIAPAGLFDGIKANRRSELPLVVKFTNGETEKTLALIDFAAGTTRTAKPIDHDYPTYRHVLPRELSGEAANYDGRYLAEFEKARIALHGKVSKLKLRIGYNGLAAAIVDLHDPNFVGVLMPWEPKEGAAPITARPAWIDDDLQPLV